MNKKNIYKIVLALIFFFAVIIRFYFFIFVDQELRAERLRFTDEQTYLGIAESIQDINFFKSDLSIRASILQPLFIFFLGKNILLIKIITIIIGSSITILSFLVSKEIVKNKNFSLIPSIIVAIHPDIVNYSTNLLTETNFTFFILLLIYFLIKIMKNSKNKKYLYGATIVYILIVLLRPMMEYFLIFFIFLFVPLIYFTKNKKKILVKKIFLIAIISYSIFALFHFKNLIIFNTPILTTGKGAPLFAGSDLSLNGDEPYLRGDKNFSHIKNTLNGLGHLTIEGDKLLTEKAIENIKNNFPEWMIINSRKPFRLIYGNSFFWRLKDYKDFNYAFSFFVYSSLLSVIFINTLGLIGMFLLALKKTKPFYFIIPILMIYIVIIHSLSFAIPRYFHPYIPLMSIYFSYMLLLFHKFLKNKKIYEKIFTLKRRFEKQS